MITVEYVQLYHLFLLAFVCIILGNAEHHQVGNTSKEHITKSENRSPLKGGNVGSGHPPMVGPGMGPGNGHGGPNGHMGGPSWPMGGPNSGKEPNGDFPHMNGQGGPGFGLNGGARH
ncbi:unnamed protein product [Cylicostephanus goldi]|uniref:Uncharacterized protein n=1 Tax=Cylicostephanus goldi TaxID=71465 RepID=A0A3P6RB21_CYLGO|nr:unnamed protein product [Cylicostephanus goldi]